MRSILKLTGYIGDNEKVLMHEGRLIVRANLIDSAEGENADRLEQEIARLEREREDFIVVTGETIRGELEKLAEQARLYIESHGGGEEELSMHLKYVANPEPELRFSASKEVIDFIIPRKEYESIILILKNGKPDKEFARVDMGDGNFVEQDRILEERCRDATKACLEGQSAILIIGAGCQKLPLKRRAAVIRGRGYPLPKKKN